TNKDSMKTLPVGLQAFQSTYGSQWHLVMAASLIVIFPLIVVFIIGQRYIVKGIMMTGLK
ncbi:MAG: carbohydrate ABC transporter permease, partial [Brevinematales bacterium]